MAKYLGEVGLIYLWGKIKTWVGNYVNITTSNDIKTLTVGNTSTTVQEKITSTDKLSADLISDGTTNKAYTATEQSKLSGIAAGAEVNQNAFGKVKVGSVNVEADAKVDTLELAAGTDSVLSITPNAANDKVIFDVDTDLNNYDNSKSGFITIKDVPEGAVASTTSPKMDGTAAVGTETAFARGDHRHPTDTSRVAANAAITGATKTKITYDSKGLVTAGADLQASDIPSIPLSKISDVTATATELNYVDGVTSSVQTQLDNKAPLASPALTGTPTAPTATAGTNTTQVATTAFVTTAIQNAQTGAAMFQGTAPTSFAPTDYKNGYYWIVGTAGSYCGETCEAGDMIYAIADYSGNYAASDFNVVQRNLDLAEMSSTDMDSATNNWA